MSGEATLIPIVIVAFAHFSLFVLQLWCKPPNPNENARYTGHRSRNVTCLFCWVVGCGDHTLEEISLLPDPCPLPNAEKKRSLNEKERLIYAPLSGVGGVVYDKVIIKLEIFHAHMIVYTFTTCTCTCTVFVSTLAGILQYMLSTSSILNSFPYHRL